MGPYAHRRTDQGEQWFDAKLGGGWWVSLLIEPRHGRSEVSEVRVKRTSKARPLTVRHLREIRLTGWDETLAPAAEREGVLRKIGNPSLLKARLATRQRKRGPERVMQQAIAAGAYVQAVQDGHRNALEVAAEDLGESKQWTRDRVSEARRRGLLTPTKQGRQGGQLTPDGEAAIQRLREEMVERLRQASGQVLTTVKYWREVEAWLEERAMAEGVDRHAMTHGQWKDWAARRMDAPDSRFR